MKQDPNERIIRRVKALLKLAEDKSNLEESQAAFMQAQQMMIKYGVHPDELGVGDRTRDISEMPVTDYKRLWWWERNLATVIAGNFRCTWYYSSKRFADSVQMRRKIVFVGYDEDVHLATEMYSLAKSALEFYTKRYLQGIPSNKNQAKKEYKRGFIDGLEEKFTEQIKKEAWGLVVLVPEAVKIRTNEITKGGRKIRHYIPHLRTAEHYAKGYEAGSKIDYMKETLDDKKMRGKT